MGGDRRIVILFLLAGFFVGQKVLAAPVHLVIAQIQTTGGPGKTVEDFVEIFNPTSESVDLEGYRLVKRTASGASDTTLKSWASPTVIQPGHYYIWGNSSVANVTPDAATNGTIADDNALALRQGAENTGEIIDAVGWGKAANILVEGAPYPANPAAGQTLQRLGEDTNNNTADFTVGAVVMRTPPPSRGGGEGESDKPKVSAKEISLVNSAIKLALKDIREPVRPSQSKLFLSEVASSQFIELENHGHTPVVLTDWLIKVDGKIVYRFDPDGWDAPTIGPRDFRVVTKKIWKSWPASAKVQLINADGKIIDETKYEQAEPDLSWTRFDEEWQWSTKATPGKPNEVRFHEACNMEHVARDESCNLEDTIQSVIPAEAGIHMSSLRGAEATKQSSEIATPRLDVGARDDILDSPATYVGEDDALLIMVDEPLSPADLTDELVGQRFVLRGEVSRKTVFGFWLSEDDDKIYVALKDAPVEKGQQAKLLGRLKEKFGRLRFEPEGAIVVESKLSEVGKEGAAHGVIVSEAKQSPARSPRPANSRTRDDEFTNASSPEQTPWPKVVAGIAGLALVWRGLKFLRSRT